MVDWDAWAEHGSNSRLETTGLADAVYGRASVREFGPEPVPREDVEAMVALAIRAANAGNAQCWRFIAVEDADLRAAMRQAVDEALDEMARLPEAAGLEKELKASRAYATFFGEAPVVVAVFSQAVQSLADNSRAARPATSTSATGCGSGRTSRASARRAAALHAAHAWATARAG